jgi:PPM family protein phosphatase
VTLNQEAPSFTPLSFRYSALTHPGALPTNEDACAVIEAPQCSVVVIADGAGGHARGEVASETVVRHIAGYIQSLGDFKPGPDVAEHALMGAQDALRSAITSSPKQYDMRSTGLVVIATRSCVWVGHVGDSRVYLIRDGVAKQLTRDDTLVQSLVDMGQLTAEEARTHSKANVLLQSLGEPRELEYHVSEKIESRVGDILVACTDGLTEVLTDEEIASLASSGTSRRAARSMLNRAIERGAPDNVTVSVLNWRESETHGKRVSISAQGKVLSRKKGTGRKRARSDRWMLWLLCLTALILGSVVLLKRYGARLRVESAPRSAITSSR